MSYREEKGRNKLAQLEKLGIELKAPEGTDPAVPGVQNEQSYYNPLATATQGKYAEQIQKRKLLWANKVTKYNINNTILLVDASVRLAMQIICVNYIDFYSRSRMTVAARRPLLLPQTLGWVRLLLMIKMEK